MKKKFLLCGAVCCLLITGAVATLTSRANDGLDALPPIMVAVEGKQLDLINLDASPYVKGEQIMVPLQPIAEALGYSVKWNAADHFAEIENDIFHMNLYPGEDSYSRYSIGMLGMIAPQQLGMAPEMKGSRMYVPAKTFELLECTVKDEDGVIKIDKAAAIADNEQHSKPAETNAGMANPVREFGSLREVEAAAGFKLRLPELYSDHGIKSIFLIHDIIEINYEDGICYRVAKGAGQDISGVYGSYEYSRLLEIGEYSGTAKGTDIDDEQRLYVFCDTKYSYSIDFGDEVSLGYLQKVIRSISAYSEPVVGSAN